MSDATDPCRCWEAPAGDLCGLSWLGDHDRVAVTAQNGGHVEGRADGAVWWRHDGAWEPGFQVMRDDGSASFVPLAAVKTMTIRRPLSPRGVVDSLSHALRPLPHTGVADPTHAATDQEQHLEVTLTVVAAPSASAEQDPGATLSAPQGHPARSGTSRPRDSDRPDGSQDE